MCGRYMLSSDADTIGAEFGIDPPAEIEPHYNIAPSQQVLIVRHRDAAREGAFVRWGLIPFWAKDPKIGYKMINARSETVTEKPAFRAAFRKRRCLVPADGYYEWQALEGGKQPYLIFPASGTCFAIAGLWESWRQDDEIVESCTLVTCAANERLSQLHHRMPVTVARDDYARWLAPDTGAADLEPLLRPAANDAFDFQAVSTTVNSPRNDSIACIEPHAL